MPLAGDTLVAAFLLSSEAHHPSASRVTAVRAGTAAPEGEPLGDPPEYVSRSGDLAARGSTPTCRSLDIRFTNGHGPAGATAG